LGKSETGKIPRGQVGLVREMAIHHIQDDPQTRLMEMIDHDLEFVGAAKVRMFAKEVDALVAIAPVGKIGSIR
jgi:hypothetical protein